MTALLVALFLSGTIFPSGVSGSPAAPAERAASPHTALESSSPAADAETSDPVEEIRLRFTTAVQPALSAIEVTGPRGPVASPEAVEAVADTEDHEIRLRLDEPLEPGRYRVSWRTAGPDGHPVRGTFEFEVVSGAEPAAPGEPGRAATDERGEPDAVPDADTSPTPGEEAADPGEPAGAAADGADGEGGAAAAETAIRWLFYLSIVGMLGTVAFRLLVLPQVPSGPGSEEVVAAAVSRARTLAWIAAGLGLLALPARLWDQSVALFGADALAAENLGALLLGTAWGGGWTLQAACLGLFLLGAAWAAPGGTRHRGWMVMAVAAAGIAVVPGLQGHAWAADGRELALLNHSLHVLGVGTWMGGLGTLVLAGLPALRRLPRPGSVHPAPREAPEPSPKAPGPAVETGASAGAEHDALDPVGGSSPAQEAPATAGSAPPDDHASPPPPDTPKPRSGAPPLLAGMVEGFSRVALGAVTLLVGTGLINGWIHLDALGELLATGYGRMLLVKVGIVAGALALGFYNWRNVRPSLRETPRPGLLRIPATLEFLLGLAVLVATALLVAQGVPT